MHLKKKKKKKKKESVCPFELENHLMKTEIQKSWNARNCHNINKNRYTNSRSQTNAESETSSVTKLHTRMQQGNTLSTALFKMFVNDMLQSKTDDDSPKYEENNPRDDTVSI